MGWKLEGRSGARTQQRHVFIVMTLRAMIWRLQNPTEINGDRKNLWGSNQVPVDSIMVRVIDSL